VKARDDDPNLHRIEVERDEAGEVEFVRFVCDGGDDAPCHHWPDCGCETWGESHGDPRKGIPPEAGHENVPQRSCWVDPWFNDALGHEAYEWIEAWDGSGDEPTHGDLYSGPISVTFEGDYMTWEYAA